MAFIPPQKRELLDCLLALGEVEEDDVAEFVMQVVQTVQVPRGLGGVGLHEVMKWGILKGGVLLVGYRRRSFCLNTKHDLSVSCNSC